MTPDCPTCNGYGEVTVCPPVVGGYGCSHANDREYRCADCNGTGELSPAVIDLTEPASSLPDPNGQEPT